MSPMPSLPGLHPPASSAAAEETHSLKTWLTALIQADGPLNIAQFMAHALMHPVYGYYRRRDPLGAHGDFITAPEISQMFGELLGLWCAQAWLDMAAPEKVHLVELGPGRGTLMADALRAARLVPGFQEALDIHLIEANSVLKETQRRTLDAFAITWHDHFETVPDGPLILIANEFFDCLPIRQFVRGEDAWYERGVGLEGEDLAFVLLPLTPDTAPGRGLPPWAARARPGDIFEVCPSGEALAAAIAARVGRHGGRALIIDYGYDRPGCGDTLQALFRHRPDHALNKPGEADLTAHVDFTRLAETARPHCSVHGPIAQGAFLASLGITQRAQTLRRTASAAQARDIDSALTRLTAPDHMGTLFKVVCLSHPDLPPPPGFEPA